MIHKQSLLMVPLLCGVLTAQADSDMAVSNGSQTPVQAIWQAIGCANIVEDWAGDTQYTVCREKTINPSEIHTFTFVSMQWDRSVKIFSKKQGEIGYCDSMDDETIYVGGGEDGDIYTRTSC